MENMQYGEELVREFLVFRGFTATLQCFDAELGTDIGKGFQVDRMLNLIFSVYIPKFQPDKLLSLLNFFKRYITSTAESAYLATLLKLELSILRCYVVHALQSGKTEKVVEFFGMKAIPYLKNPNLDPQFRIYFSREWYDALQLSVRNFFCVVFNGSRLPAILKISSEKNTVHRLKKDIKQLNLKLSQLQALLEEKEAHLIQQKSESALVPAVKKDQIGDVPTINAESLLRGMCEEGIPFCKDDQGAVASSAPLLDESESRQHYNYNAPQKFISFMSSDSICSSSYAHPGEERQGSPYTENGETALEELPEVKVDFQETFLGHTSPISRCRFSASGDNIASASVDGTVRIWTYDPSTPSSRNATIYCGTEITALDWDCKSDRLLLIGTADGRIKAWNVDAKRVVCDLSTSKQFSRVLDVKCSPVEPIFVSAAASKGQVTNSIQTLGFASLTVWNMKTWKAMSVLPLGEDPPAITSLCFNHNGKILAASAIDGMIHMFDMAAGLQITGWPAHDSAISSILFGPDETSIFSLGIDGKIFEWSLQNPGQVLWSRNCSRFCKPTSASCRHEMALDANGKRLLVTSDLVRAPIYQVQGDMNGLRTLPHSAAITTVDWHPTLPIFLTGSADNSVRVTSIL
uniref:WD repeat-containing protein 91 homolog n=1 Tax=Kalanchoe fedtschenkoi TaxID=63787 RepID=A0A7N0UPP8_KALFE